VKPIERDEQMQREYIPLAGGYEWQAKGNGSTVRIVGSDGNRHPLSWNPPHVSQMLDDCMRAQHADMNANSEAVGALVEACEKVIEMNRQHAQDAYGDAEKAETWACVVTLRKALATYGREGV